MTNDTSFIGSIEKTVQLVIIEEGSYEKDVLLYVNLGEPQQVGDDELTGIIEAAESKAAEDLTEEDKMALLGRPKAGDIVRAQLRIKENLPVDIEFNTILTDEVFSASRRPSRIKRPPMATEVEDDGCGS
ncbi:conserved hypothetical protein [Culex quinquefasciatus]|uniref:Uncharacterized protein n=1 Tax=Culex quinquefasciatus TaxID=7176 RepID=B0WFC6_CULQU|nr:conserved hypothetical protein [Culex quinquefasciatus]|eukprot:XP_001847410.1 conserved hypothetical protein [Culex quinquefasciatus]